MGCGPLLYVIFREHPGTRAFKLFRRPAANSLRIVRDSSPILIESLMTASIQRAASLRPGRLKHLIRVASVTGRLPERDVMLSCLTHTTGIRVTELALLEVADVLYPSGAIKPEVYPRADITKGSLPRNVYLTHARCLAALKAWLKVRNRRRCGLSGAEDYRGLRPSSKLVTTYKGRAFELAFKHRELDRGPEVYRACDSLQQTISRLYRQVGIKLGSSHSGRSTLTAKVPAATVDVETVQTILGHSCLDRCKPYLTVNQVTIRRAFAVALA